MKRRNLWRYLSLWRCPTCLRARSQEAFSLHGAFTKRILCLSCGSIVTAELKPRARKGLLPRIRKVAMIKLADPKKASLVTGPLNDAAFEGRWLDIAAHLNKLKKNGVIIEWEYTTRQDLI